MQCSTRKNVDWKKCSRSTDEASRDYYPPFEITSIVVWPSLLFVSGFCFQVMLLAISNFLRWSKRFAKKMAMQLRTLNDNRQGVVTNALLASLCLPLTRIVRFV